jgi:hypothetical protein
MSCHLNPYCRIKINYKGVDYYCNNIWETICNLIFNEMTLLHQYQPNAIEIKVAR